MRINSNKKVQVFLPFTKLDEKIQTTYELTVVWIAFLP
jgi:hypothetical protein